MYQIKTKLKHLEKRKLKKYLGIFEADTIKWVEMKVKRKSTSGEPENYSRQNYTDETLSKE